MLVKECVDGFERYIDVESKDDQVPTQKTDFQVSLNYFDIKKGDVNLDEVKDKLLGLKDFSITYNTASSTIACVTSVGSASDFFEEYRLRVRILAGTKFWG